MMMVIMGQILTWFHSLPVASYIVWMTVTISSNNSFIGDIKANLLKASTETMLTFSNVYIRIHATLYCHVGINDTDPFSLLSGHLMLAAGSDL